MADVLDFTPAVVNLIYYAGDSPKFTVLTNPPTYTDGAIWSAQIRNVPGSDEVLEFFTIELVEGGACHSLTAEQTRRLAELGVVKRARGCDVYQVFNGVWDTQVIWTETGEVQTLARGSLSVHMDVTRDAVVVLMGPAVEDDSPPSPTPSELTINVDTMNNPIIYVEVIGGCGSGGGGGGTGIDEVWVGTEAPLDPALELWVDTDAEAAEPAGAQVLSQRKPRRRYQRAAPAQRATQPASMDHIVALMVRIEALERRIRELEG